jgi:hypothetical protein
MKARIAKNSNGHAGKNIRRPTNLTLSKGAKRMAVRLQKAMFRPSISNLVETLIHEKALVLGLSRIEWSQTGAVLSGGRGAQGREGVK